MVERKQCKNLLKLSMALIPCKQNQRDELEEKNSLCLLLMTSVYLFIQTLRPIVDFYLLGRGFQDINSYMIIYKENN